MNPGSYSGLAKSTRTLYDAFLAVYNYKGLEERELAHSVLMMLHIFFGSILLLNYLIAILNNVYQ